MKNIKKMLKLIYMSCILILSAVPSQVSASSQWKIEKLADTAVDYLEIMDLENSIRNDLKNFYYQAMGTELPESFQLDLGQAKKIYVDAQVFSLKSSDTASFMQELENSDYMWLLPVQIGEDVFQVHIARGLPVREAIRDELSEDEIRRIEEKEGKWSLSGIELLKETEIDFERQVSDALEKVSYYDKDAQVVLCGGLNHIDNPAAVVLNSQKAELLIPMYDLKIDGTLQQIEEIMPQSAEKDSGVYLYDKIKEAANSMQSMKEYYGGSSWLELTEQDSPFTVPWYLPAACISIITLTAMLYWNWRRNAS